MHFKSVQVHCARCGLTGEGFERGGKRRVHYEKRDVYCSTLFENGECPNWSEAVVKTWLAYDGLTDETPP